MKFTAVAFDLDGTLYPEYRLNLRLLPFIIKEQRLLRAFGRARKLLRDYDRDCGGRPDFPPETKVPHGGDFYDAQAAIIGKILGEGTEIVREKTERLIYRGWEPLFNEVKLFPHVRETLEAFRKAGIKLGILSDFPLETKLENLKINHYWDVVLCSELTGHIKPSPLPFLELARRMGMPAGEILYVGNSAPYDAEGSRGAGMKSALVCPAWKRLFAVPNREIPGGTPADFCFSDYRQLCEYVLN